MINMDSPPINLQKTQRSNSMFHPTATTSDEEMIPKKFRRIRSRHHKTIRNSNNDLDILPSSQNYNTYSFTKPNSFPDEESNLPCPNGHISLNDHHQPSTSHSTFRVLAGLESDHNHDNIVDLTTTPHSGCNNNNQIQMILITMTE